MAQTSESALAAAMRPNQYGSSTTGVKKSTVCTTARSGVERVHGSVVARLGADERARVRHVGKVAQDLRQVRRADLAGSTRAVRQRGEPDDLLLLGHRRGSIAAPRQRPAAPDPGRPSMNCRSLREGQSYAGRGHSPRLQVQLGAPVAGRHLQDLLPVVHGLGLPAGREQRQAQVERAPGRTADSGGRPPGTRRWRPRAPLRRAAPRPACSGCRRRRGRASAPAGTRRWPRGRGPRRGTRRRCRRTCWRACPGRSGRAFPARPRSARARAGRSPGPPCTCRCRCR